MRVMILLCLLLLPGRVVAQPKPCTTAYADDVARSQGDEFNKGREALKGCLNSATLLKYLFDLPRVDAPSKEKPPGPRTTTTPPKTTPPKTTPPKTTPPKTTPPKTTPPKTTPPKTTPPKTTPPKTPPAPAKTTTLDAKQHAQIAEDLIEALEQLKQKLLERVRTLKIEHQGLASSPRDALKQWIADFTVYLALVKDAPEPALRDAAALIAAVADQSPEARLAQLVAEALDRMTPERRQKFLGDVPQLTKAVNATSLADRFAALLEQPEYLDSAYSHAQVAALGPSRVATSGHAVIVSFDARGVTEKKELGCVKDIRGRLEVALGRKIPVGMKWYEFDSPRAKTPQVSLVASLIGPDSPDSKSCPTTNAYCVKIVAKAYTGDAADDALPPRDFYSEGFAGCPGAAQDDVDRVMGEALASVAVKLRADEFSLNDAHMIRAGCVEFVSEGDNSAAKALLRVRDPEKEVFYLEAADAVWPGFRQELSATLAPHHEMFGPVVHEVPQSKTPGLMLSWRTTDKDVPRQVDLTLRWKGSEDRSSANVTLTRKDTEGCKFDKLSLQQTLASATTSWLMGLQFTRTPPPPTEETGENWKFAPLGLLFAGLPQLLDEDKKNDKRGVIYATADAALLSATAVLVLLSIDARNDFSENGDQDSLDRANDLLTAGYVVGVAVAVPRLFSVFW